jgi:NDP-sugar pyrophosphorylase family protein
MPFKNLALVGIVTCAFVFAGCGSGDPVVNYENSPIVANSSIKNMKDVKRAIILSGARIGWQMQDVKPGLINATMFSRGHMAKVEITYTTSSYNIKYKDSSNMKYDGQNIHGTYNKWVERLHRNIRAALSSQS